MRLLMVSHVWPRAGTSGQGQRVADMAAALAEAFETDLLFVGDLPDDQRAPLPSRFRRIFSTGSRRSPIQRLRAHLKGYLHGLRPSIDALPALVRQWKPPADPFWKQYHAILFEYMHYAPVARTVPVPSICDTHNILSHAPSDAGLPPPFRRARALCYEKKAWQAFDALIAINRKEQQYIAGAVPSHPVWYCPPGIDCQQWPRCWQGSVTPFRLLYYGSLSRRNTRHIRFLTSLMPALRRASPDVELHLVGKGTEAFHHPAAGIIGHGYVPTEQLPAVFRTMSLALLPWEGRYGFRLRLLELAAVGLPVAATPDALWGMEWDEDACLSMPSMDSPREWIRRLEKIFRDPSPLPDISRKAYALIARHYRRELTYPRIARAIRQWLHAFKRPPHFQQKT